MKVGIVGASAGNSWASRSHVPAIAAVDGMTLTSVATSRRESAEASARQFGAVNGFVGVEEMAQSDDVDLVIVAVKVPHHRQLVQAVLDAGKHVYCEWPLGADLREAEQMASDAASAPGRNAVGLQARSSPTLRYLRDLLRDGYIGSIESCSGTAFSQRGADPVTPAKRYLFENQPGANLSTIEAGHLVDALAFLFGEPDEFLSHSTLRRPSLSDSQGGSFQPETADTVTILMDVGGAPVSVHLAQGTHALFTTEISILGSSGAFHLSTTAPGGIQMAPLELRAAGTTTGLLELLEVPDSYRTVQDPGLASAVNVAEALNAFLNDIRNGSQTVPDFGDAVVRHRTIATLPASRLFEKAVPAFSS